jgi:hypothetical protein
MSVKRKIEMIVSKTSFLQSEEDDLIYWMNQTANERLKEMLGLKTMIWGSSKYPYPNTITNVVEKKIKEQTDKDDF